MDPRIAAIEKEYVRKDLPKFAPGDTVRVRVRVREGDKERVQPFEGVCIARRGAGVNATFTLRRVSGGVGVERIFPLHSPWIAGLEVVRRGDVRRAKLYYLRSRKGKRARVRERKWWLDKPAAGAEDAYEAQAAELAEMAAEAAEAEAEGAEDEEGGMAAAVGGAIGDAVEKVKDVAGDVAEKVEDVAEDVVEKVKDVAEDVAEKVEDVVEDVVEAVTGHDQGEDEDEKRSAGDDAAE